MGYGAGHPLLRRYVGRDVTVCVDPNDVSRCQAFTADPGNRRFIATLAANQRISPNASVEEVREACHAVGKRRKVMVQAARSAAKRTRTVAAELNAHRNARLAELRKPGTDDA